MGKETKGAYWRKLDNAAKLYSAASNKKDTRVFRFYCELKEEIIEEKLQRALDKTVEKYPVFLSVMRSGLFWHYLEKSSLRPVVREEYREPCSSLYIRDKKELLFEVTYYKRRINFEVFHALTDGTGASEFIRELVKNYLVAAHEQEGLADIPLADQDVTVSDQEDDGFAKYYSKDVKRKKEKKQAAYQIKKGHHELGNMQITEAEVPVKEIAAKAKEHGVSITIYLTAALMCAIHKKMTKRQEVRPVVVMVPVNLRKFFPSDSMLNFFNWIEPGYQFGQGDDSFENVLKQVREFFEKELTRGKMAERMNEYFALEVNPVLRFVPLELKNFCISAGTRTSAKDVTAILSNLGVIHMPEEYEAYIERFGVFTNTPKAELSMCSFRDKLYLGITSRYDCAAIKKNFFKILEEDGIQVKMLETEYPEEIVPDSTAWKLYKIFSFLCIVSIVTALGTDYIIDQHFRISFFVSGGVLSMWLATSIGFRKRYNPLKNAMWQLWVITIGCALWDVLTGWRGWSVNYIFPGVSLTVMIFMFLLSRIYYRVPEDYVIYFVVAAGYGLILPLVFIVSGLVTVVFPSVISICTSVILLAALALFKGREFKEEMQKKFHI